MEWEVSIIEWIQREAGDVGTLLAKVFSFFGSETGIMLAILIILFCWEKKTGRRLALIIVAVNVWLPMVKAVVLRPRPYMTYPDRVEARALVSSEGTAQDVGAQGYSFPSTHSASAAALYISLAREVKTRWMWILAVALTLLVGISRVVVGAHYPTDVLAGWALGLAVIGVFLLAEKLIKRTWVRVVLLLLSALPGLFYVRTQDYFTSLGMLAGLIAALFFEEKYVQFRDTRNLWAMALRLVCAFAVYYALNTLLKLPFDKAFLNSGSLSALLIRALRYMVDIFVLIGVYPMAFPLFERVGKRKNDP